MELRVRYHKISYNTWVSNYTLTAFYFLKWQGAVGSPHPCDFAMPLAFATSDWQAKFPWSKGHKTFCSAKIIAQALIQHPFMIALLLQTFHFL